MSNGNEQLILQVTDKRVGITSKELLDMSLICL